jgi:hypothetical protein
MTTAGGNGADNLGTLKLRVTHDRPRQSICAE